MPRNVRNFWVETSLREGSLGEVTRRAGTGPRGKEGTFTTAIKIRDAGSVRDALTVEGFAEADGTLTLIVFADGQRIHTLTTWRDPCRVHSHPVGQDVCERCGERRERKAS